MNTKKQEIILHWILLEWTNKNSNRTRRKFLKVGVQKTYRPDILHFRFFHCKRTLEKWGIDFSFNSSCFITYEFNTFKIDGWKDLLNSTAFRAYSIGAKEKRVVDLHLHNHK